VRIKTIAKDILGILLIISWKKWKRILKYGIIKDEALYKRRKEKIV